MTKNNLYPIGTVAKLFHVSVSILRHYEKVGILIPKWIDPDSNYRYYSSDQFEVLNTIRYLRALDMPLKEIEDFLSKRDVDKIEEKLLKQKESVIQKRKELERIEKKIDNRLEQLHDAKNSNLDEIQEIISSPSKITLFENQMEIHEFYDMEKPIRKLDSNSRESNIFLGKVGIGISQEHLDKNIFTQYDYVFLLLDEEDCVETKTITLEETKCVRIRFCGTHMDAEKYYLKLIEYIHEHNLKINGFSREISMIDYGFTNDTSKFVTEICIPVV